VAAEGHVVTVCVALDDLSDVRSTERALAEVRLQCSAALGIDAPELELDHDSLVPRGTAEVRIDGRVCGSTPLDEGSAGEDALVVMSYRAVMEHATSLVDLQDLDRMLEELRATHPAVVRRALDSVDLVDVLAVVRGFLRERIVLPPLRTVLGVLAENRRFGDDSERGRFAEIARAELAPHWAPAVVQSLQRLGPVTIVRLTPDAEDELAQRWTPAVDGGVLNLSDSERRSWIAAIRALSVDEDEVAEQNAPTKRPILVLTTPACRPAVAQLVAGAVPRITVMSTAEVEVTSVDGEREVQWLAGP
jgi:flagellar biosynthesis component FlhA